MRRWIPAAAVLMILLAGPGRGASATGQAVPSLDGVTYAAVAGGPLTITGSNLGPGNSGRVEFSAGSDLEPGEAGVTSWSASEIKLDLPPDVRDGTVRVVVEGAASEPAQLRVFEYVTYPLLSGTGASETPLDIDIDAGGRLWILEEAHSHLKWLEPATGGSPAATGRIEIPQAAGAGIFANLSGGIATRTRLSGRGEDIDIAGDGSIWFTQGGLGFFEGGVFPNPSRVVRYAPATGQFSCYPVPVDNAQTIGMALDPVRGRAWYSDAGISPGSALMSFRMIPMPSDCLWDPHVTPTPPLGVCLAGQIVGCHERVPLGGMTSPAHITVGPDGVVWFTEYWNTSIVRYEPETGVLWRFPMPAPLSQPSGFLYVGSGVWDLEFDGAGMLWITEYNDGTVMRFDPARMAENDCTVRDTQGGNPCMDELYVGYPDTVVHSISVSEAGDAWFTGIDRVGLIPGGVAEAAMIELPGAGDLTGIVFDEARGSAWFNLFDHKRVGVLRPATGDADGVDDVADNCPDAWNPEQANADANFVDLSAWGKAFNDLTWPASDEMGDACDADADNDGLSNDEEASGCGGHGASDPAAWDSDADGVLDGAECMFGTNPLDAASSPPRAAADDGDRDGLSSAYEAQIGTDPADADTDGDRIGDGIEVRHFGSSPRMVNSDADACADGMEATSLNTDRAVNSIDLLLLAMSFGSRAAPQYVPAFDVNRDDRINSADLGMAAANYGVC